ncbi:MAG: bifunctional folylpolyglutamate synthase/dihydrofolate synthase [Prevotella sp.]
MNYQQTTNYLFNQLPMFERQGKSGYKSGLENTFALDEHYGHPHRCFKTIHVAGTNGKGSCSHTIAALLQENGYKVGLYTSPHLVDFRERIRVNGMCISEKYVVDFVDKGIGFFEPLHPSFFELTTAMAFNYFRDMEVDIAVVEVGLGGRLDCTNIITPELSVITNISLDHTQFLGDTFASIAREKAGIIKRGVPVVVGEANEQTRPVFERIASENDAPITFAEDEAELLSYVCGHKMKYSTKHYGMLNGQLAGIYQARNTNTILTVYAKLVEMGIVKNDVSALQKALDGVVETTGLLGRWQTVQTDPLVVCDTGHNVAAWQYLGQQIGATKCNVRRIVFGMVDDKDIRSVAKLLPLQAIYYFTQANSHRAIKAMELANICMSNGLLGNVYSTVNEAYRAALSDSNADDLIFVGGSSYVVADFLSNCF